MNGELFSFYPCIVTSIVARDSSVVAVNQRTRLKTNGDELW